MALVIILLFCLTAATFVSHTVASLILMPVIATLGISLGMPEIAVMGSAFAGNYTCQQSYTRFVFTHVHYTVLSCEQCRRRWRCLSPLSPT